MSELGQKIIEGVRAAANKHPDHVYKKTDMGGCQYVRDGAPSCIVGHALWAAGLIDSTCKFDERDNSGIDIIIRDEGWPLDVSEVDWLCRVQGEQDSGTPWGKAVELADKGFW